MSKTVGGTATLSMTPAWGVAGCFWIFCWHPWIFLAVPLVFFVGSLRPPDPPLSPPPSAREHSWREKTGGAEGAAPLYLQDLFPALIAMGEDFTSAVQKKIFFFPGGVFAGGVIAGGVISPAGYSLAGYFLAAPGASPLAIVGKGEAPGDTPPPPGDALRGEGRSRGQSAASTPILEGIVPK